MCEPKISVIVPVYNTQDYLAECIESVLKQSFQDFEIICIDDGSGDNSGLILKEFAEKDKRITIITQNNKGVSIARNEGIKQAKGKYIYFLDSDDYIEEDALEISCRTMEEKALDAAYFDTVAFGEEDFSKEFIAEKNRYYARTHDYSAIYTGEELLCKLLQNHEYTCPIWKQVIRRDLLTDNNIDFYDGIIHQDELYTIQTMMLAKRVLYINRTLHHRRLRKNSIMTKPLGYHSVYSYFLGVKEAYRFLLKKDCNQQNKGLILSHLKRLSVLARSQYSKLPEAEQNKYLDFKEEDKFLFELCIVDGVGALKQRNRLSEEIKNLLKERENERKQMVDLQAKAAMLEQKNTEARKQLQTSEYVLAKEREESRKQLQESATELAKEREDKKKQLDAMQSKLMQVEKLEAELLKKLNDAESIWAKEREESRKQLQESATELAKEREDKKKQLDAMQSKLMQVEKLEAELLKKLNDAESIWAKERENYLKQIKDLRQKLEKEKGDKEKEIRRLSRHLNDVKTGWSFSMGRIITFVPRKVRDFLKK